MKHIKLFEDFSGVNPSHELVNLLMEDPDFNGYRFSLKGGGDITFIIWENPEENERWLNSGYAEYYESGDDASMPVLGIQDNGTMFKLSPEEKYSYSYHEDGNAGSIYTRTGEIDYNKAKNELEDSIWNYQG
jgi:hypothetical protein